MMIQTTGSYNGDDDSYSFSICKDELAVTVEGLCQQEIQDLADLFLCLLYRDGEPYTWHSELEPNDVY
jgi:hypothetical protein